jgi:hypothetical protein
MARLAAIIAPPRYPLVRFAGVLAPRSAWRREVVPQPRERRHPCNAVRADEPAPANGAETKARKSRDRDECVPVPRPPSSTPHAQTALANDFPMSTALAHPPTQPGDVNRLAPNVIAVKHWDRLLGGLLYTAQPHVDWATLLRRSFSVDVLECPKCHGRLRMIAVITERQAARRILAHLGLPTEPPPIARARDPTEQDIDVEAAAQLDLGLV